jgi:peroxiredoxin Q/BCP
MKVGDTVEEFTLEDQRGDQVSLTSLLETGPLVVYFYIKAMTPG